MAKIQVFERDSVIDVSIYHTKLSNSDDPTIPSGICTFHCKEGTNQHQLMSSLSGPLLSIVFSLSIGFYTSQVVVWGFFHQPLSFL